MKRYGLLLFLLLFTGCQYSGDYWVCEKVHISQHEINGAELSYDGVKESNTVAIDRYRIILADQDPTQLHALKSTHIRESVTQQEYETIQLGKKYTYPREKW